MPFAHMEELRSLCKSPVAWLESTRAGHMDAYASNSQKYWEALGEFWKEHVLPSSKTASLM